MLAAPPAVDDTENARAAITQKAEQIVADTKREVDSELDRMEAAKDWALAEMDLATARAKKDLDEGKDPDEVQQRLEAELTAAIAKANDPGFDPRTDAPAPSAAPGPIAEPAARKDVAPPAEVAKPTTELRDPAAAPPAEATPPRDPAPAPPAEAKPEASADASACACRPGRSDSVRPLAFLSALLLGVSLLQRR